MKKNWYLRVFKVDPLEENLRVRTVYTQLGYYVLAVRAFSTGIIRVWVRVWVSVTASGYCPSLCVAGKKCTFWLRGEKKFKVGRLVIALCLIYFSAFIITIFT